MGLPQDSFVAPSIEVESHLTKRRRFAPNTLPPVIPVSDNTDIEHHTFDSPLILQLCEQAPDQAEIEAGLLQVGMRVRKAVAEGYKNQPKKFTPRPFFDVNKLSPETQAAIAGGNVGATAELAPFAASQVQPLSTATFCGINLAFLSHCSEEPPSSSVSHQSLWSYSTSHKRGHEVESDSEESQDWQPQTPNLHADAGMAMPVDYFAIDMDTMGEVSQMSHVSEQARQQQIHGRRMAMPKSRSRFLQPAQSQMAPTSAFSAFANMAAEQPQPETVPAHSTHKRMMSCGMEAMDFGEAPFLQRREDVEMDCS
ncbi:hypothetical protein HRR83_001655 [Exophiala dermatitidis]|uniref:Uncharacterized protein n=2 Tax=Exophiala dermatitidis TaxID=5970 RepID=H6C5T0_EXODN|nr:uncharacterized protein HMPREF1120_07075 [Exophiala dermatitidis NIH/UT8656]KAJ4516326.1 hypothetical protein HRR73_004789 [Exophiala dermatitidis]EHY59076.1 hypothetical protein HMPREF1120_07075 [Exophiala dermatitidis NIH/UT8656]KAJ4523133.1 hypothetical protein HRR75_001532 [Exophiala dermatitidis]KAJ4526461.1 hypothetical protein HRR74_001659 [Exophiala dermatitidis]KAJ4532293.1 hypothetical protein HRR76_007291 [Exophiala dermatitidis]